MAQWQKMIKSESRYTQSKVWALPPDEDSFITSPIKYSVLAVGLKWGSHLLFVSLTVILSCLSLLYRYTPLPEVNKER